MEFKTVLPPAFGIDSPPKPYPEAKPDRDGNYTLDDKDYSSGDSFGPDELDEIHSRSDVDSGPFAQHHTIGPGGYQASPGNHIHDGVRSKKIGDGLGLTISGSRGGNAALASLISALSQVVAFTDNTTP
jgi:hypothetical protein